MNRRNFLKTAAALVAVPLVGLPLIPNAGVAKGGYATLSSSGPPPTIRGYHPIMRPVEAYWGKTNVGYIRAVYDDFYRRKKELYVPPVVSCHHYPPDRPVCLGHITDLHMCGDTLYARLDIKWPHPDGADEYYVSAEVMLDPPELLAVALVHEKIIIPEFPKYRIGTVDIK